MNTTWRPRWYPQYWLYYADQLLELPVGLVAVALGTVIYRISSSARNDQQRFNATLDWGLHLVLCFTCSCGLVVSAEPLVAVMFEFWWCYDGTRCGYGRRCIGMFAQLLKV